MADGRTPNFGLILPEGNRKNWTDKANGNFRSIDALIATYVSVTNLQGLWTNNTEYDVGDNVIDESSGVVYTAQVEHVSSSAPTTFLEEREDHPTYWLTFATAARNRGAWATATAYAVNDFVLADGTKYAMCIEAHTSGANFTTDEAAGKWEIMIDLSTVGSLVLPVLSGAADADKVVMTDSGGNSYVINSATALLAVLLSAQGATGSGSFALAVSPAFTGNPTAPTATAESNNATIATAAYADRAIRALIPRVQTFSSNGTYTPHEKMIYCIIKALGAGGGGGGSTLATTGGQVAVAGAGGAGSQATAVKTASDIGESQAITIGTAGTGGSAGTNNGNAGGDTSVGALVVGKGGSGGTAGAAGSNTFSAGGAGGIAGTGDITSVGMGGASGGTQIIFIPTRGGSTVMGSGGVASPANLSSAAAGGNASGFGSGGGGAYAPAGSSNQAGGNGAGGYVEIIEICWG